MATRKKQQSKKRKASRAAAKAKPIHPSWTYLGKPPDQLPPEAYRPSETVPPLPRAIREGLAKQADQVGYTLDWIQYHPERGIVRLHVVEMAEIKGERVPLGGEDRDIALNDLSEDIKAALKDALVWLAEDEGVTAVTPTEE